MGRTMLSKNFSELENRVRATMNKVSADLHTKTASSLFNVDCQDVTKEQRKSAKAYNYGRFYSMSAEDLLSLLNMEEK